MYFGGNILSFFVVNVSQVSAVELIEFLLNVRLLDTEAAQEIFTGDAGGFLMVAVEQFTEFLVPFQSGVSHVAESMGHDCGVSYQGNHQP